MKIKKEHYEHIKSEIQSVLILHGTDVVKAHKESLKYDERVKDIDRRFRWDLSYAANLTPFICENLYPYVNDTHIDTALKSIVRELNL